MSDEDKGGLIVIVVVVVPALIFFAAGVTVGYDCGSTSTESAIRAEAVKAGAARWECNPKTGKVKFVWNVEPASTEER